MSVWLEPVTLAEIRAQVAAMSPEERGQMSDVWLANLAAAERADVWAHGFHVVHTDGGRVGTCGFTGPPDAAGTAEIAYRIDAVHRGRGYAKSAARELIQFALSSGSVRRLQAHTLAEEGASPAILRQVGFEFMGEIEHPTDGRIWRWERALP